MRLLITINVTDMKGDQDLSQLETNLKEVVHAMTGSDPAVYVNDMNGTNTIDSALILDKMRKRPY